MNKTHSVAVEVKGVSKTYTLGRVQVKALCEVDVWVEPEEFVVAIGPSGSGKSTLLNIMGCLDRPTSGAVFIGNEDVSRLPSRYLPEIRNRKIGFIFQNFNLVPVLTAVENVELPLMLQSMTRTERRRRALAMLEQVGLYHVAHHRPDEMSGGQRQRVAIARALVTTPQIVLADEPTGNLDSKAGSDILDLMKEINKQHGTAFFVASHDDAVMARAQRLVRLKDGRIVH